MKLRTKLILAFVVLSVVPLTGVTVFSYRSSIEAFRETVEREARGHTDEMSRRMELATQDLDRRIEGLGELPYDAVMAAAATDHDSPGRFLSRFIEEMGETAPLIEALEFRPGPSARSAVAPPPSGKNEPGEFEINLAGMWAVRDASRPVEQTVGTHAHAVRIGNVSVLLPCSAMGDDCGSVPEEFRAEDLVSLVTSVVPQVDPEVSERLADVEAMVHAIVGRIEQRVEIVRNGVQPDGPPRPEMPRSATAKAPTVPSLNLAREFESPVHRGKKLVGHVKARVDTGRVLRDVLVRVPTEEGEIPFAVGSDGQIYAPDSADETIVGDLGLAALGSEGSATDGPENWVVVTHEDEALGVTFGIARPVGESLGQIRRATGRNLIYGLAMISVSMLGIVPLSSRMTRNLSSLSAGVDRLAEGNLDARVPVRSKDEIGRLSAAFNDMAGQLHDNQQKLLERERLRRELEMCRRIQEELLPGRSGRLPFAEVRALSIPARELGGDFFNYFALEDGSAALLMGDVSGKGVPAALLMANLQATLRARLPLESNLSRLAEALDRELEASTQPESYLTLFVCVIESGGRRMRYVNAGHNTQYLYRKDGGVEQLSSTGRPLGLYAGGAYVARSLELRDGDWLCLFTDGLVEAENGEGEWFGEQRLEALFEQASGGTPDELVTRIEQAIRAHRGQAEASDDATMLVLRVESITD
jgi:serine phosphatase RsbU (regulator of sigma subunit)